MNIADKRIEELTQYKDLEIGDVFEIHKSGYSEICIKTSLAIEGFGDDCEIYGLKKDGFGRYREEFAVNLKTGLHFDVEPDKVVRKIKATIVVED